MCEIGCYKKIANALKEHSVFGLRLSELRARLPENFPEALFEEILDQPAQKDHGKRYVQKSESLRSMLERENIMNTPEFEILESRLKNKTLEEIANQYGLTRERIRQKQEKAIRKIRKIADCSNVMITENRFRPLLKHMRFRKTFLYLNRTIIRNLSIFGILGEKERNRTNRKDVSGSTSSGVDGWKLGEVLSKIHRFSVFMYYRRWKSSN